MSTKLIQQDDERRRRRRRAQPTRVRARHPLSIHLLSLHRALHATQRFSKRRPYLFVRHPHRIARREPLAFIRIVERLRAVRKPILAHRARRLSRERLRLARDRVTSLEPSVGVSVVTDSAEGERFDAAAFDPPTWCKAVAW